MVLIAISLTVLQAAPETSMRPAAGAGTEARTLVFYASTRPAYSLANGLEALKLHLQRVATRLETLAISNATPDRVAGADYIVVYCPQFLPDTSTDFLRLIAGANKPVLWIGHGADKLAELAPFKSQFDVTAFAAGRGVTNVSYRGRDWKVAVDSWIPASLPANSTAQVLMSFPDHTGSPQATRPLCWKAAHATFFAAEPSAGMLGFLFEDLLFDFYAVKQIPASRVFLRIEDYHCRCNHREFRRLVDYLFARGHPFMVAVRPDYRNPSSGESLDLDSQPEFVEVLRYAQQRGGRLLMRGYSHAYTDETGEGYEFWDAQLDRPIAGQTAESVRNQLRQGASRMLRHGLLPLAWETPHYAASSTACSGIARGFSTAVERVQLSDATCLANGEIGGLTIDGYGRLIVPENLGYPLDTPADFDDPIKSRAEIITRLRGAVAGCFIHPYQSFDKVAAVVETLERFQVPFLDLADLDNCVELPDALLLTGNAQHTVTLRNTVLRSKVYDRTGRLLAEKREPTASSGERAFKRTGAGDCELFEFSEAN
jgi:uncharacterized protein YdaL